MAAKRGSWLVAVAGLGLTLCVGACGAASGTQASAKSPAGAPYCAELSKVVALLNDPASKQLAQGGFLAAENPEAGPALDAAQRALEGQLANDYQAAAAAARPGIVKQYLNGYASSLMQSVDSKYPDPAQFAAQMDAFMAAQSAAAPKIKADCGIDIYHE